MNTIQSQNPYAAGPYQGAVPVPGRGTGDSPAPAAAGADTLSLSGSDADDGRLAATRDVELQNRLSVLADFPAALRATAAARTAAAGNPAAALAAQANVSPASVLSLVNPQD
jgi:hypothetical protein